MMSANSGVDTRVGSGGDLAPSLGGRKNFRGPRFLNDDFPFSPPKFLITFFSHRPGFSDFPLFTVIKCPIRPFLGNKNHYFRKEFLNKTIFYSVHPFAHIRQRYFSKYWGTNAWAVLPPQILGGPSPPRSPPLRVGLMVKKLA